MNSPAALNITPASSLTSLSSTVSPGTPTACARRVFPRRIAGLVAVFGLAATACGSSGTAEPTGPTLPPDSTAILAASAPAMGGVESVAFEVTATGAPIYIDQFESIALTKILGEFELDPGVDTSSASESSAASNPSTDGSGAQAVLDVTVNGSLNTQLAAIALGEEVWLSNPVTGNFETLPAGYDLDPSRFFDPKNGWEPLLANLADVEYVGRVERDGDRYHLRGTATAEQVQIITAGLVRGQDLAIDVWIQPVTGLVRAIEFTTDIDGGATEWVVTLDDYGAEFEIAAPPEVS